MASRDGLQNGSSLDVNGNASPVIPIRTSHDGGTIEGYPLAFLQTRDNPTTQQKGGSSTQAFAAPSPAPIISSSSSLSSTLNVDAEPAPSSSDGQGQQLGDRSPGARSGSPSMSSAQSQHTYASADHLWGLMQSAMSLSTTAPPSATSLVNDAARKEELSKSLSVPEQETSVERPPISLRAQADINERLLLRSLSVAGPVSREKSEGASAAEEASKTSFISAQMLLMRLQSCRKGEVIEHNYADSLSSAAPRRTNHDDEDEAEAKRGDESDGLVGKTASKSSEQRDDASCLRGIKSVADADTSWRYTGIASANGPDFGYLDSRPPRASDPMNWDLAAAVAAFPASSASTSLLSHDDGILKPQRLSGDCSSSSQDDCVRGTYVPDQQTDLAQIDVKLRHSSRVHSLRNVNQAGKAVSPKSDPTASFPKVRPPSSFPSLSRSWPQPFAGKESTSSTANEYASPATSTPHFDQLARAEPLILIVLRKPSSLPFPPSRGVHEADRAICTTIGAVRVGLPPTPDKATSHVAGNFELADNSISLLALESYCLDDMSKRRLSHVVSTSLSEPGASAVAGLSSMPAAVVGRMASSSRQRRRWAKDVVIIDSYDDDDELAEAQTSSSEAECSASNTSTSSSSSLPVTPDKGGSQSRHRSPQAFLDAIHCLSSPPPSSSSSSPSLCDPHPCPKSTSSLSPSSSPASSLASSSAQQQEFKRLPVNWFYVEGGIASLRNTTPGFGAPNNARQTSASSSLDRLSLNGAKQQDVPSCKSLAADDFRHEKSLPVGTSPPLQPGRSLTLRSLATTGWTDSPITKSPTWATETNVSSPLELASAIEVPSKKVDVGSGRPCRPTLARLDTSERVKTNMSPAMNAANISKFPAFRDSAGVDLGQDPDTTLPRRSLTILGVPQIGPQLHSTAFVPRNETIDSGAAQGSRSLPSSRSESGSENSLTHSGLQPPEERPAGSKAGTISVARESVYTHPIGSVSAADGHLATFEVSEIIPRFLFVGPEVATAAEVSYLRNELGIRRILNCAFEVEQGGGHHLQLDNPGESGIEVYKKMPLKDTVEAQDIQSYLEEACQILDDARMSSSPIYVHCKAGKSRSVMVVMAYLIHANRWPLQRSYSFVVDRRRSVSPNIGFVGELMAFEATRLDTTAVKVAHDKAPSSRLQQPYDAKNHLESDLVMETGQGYGIKEQHSQLS